MLSNEIFVGDQVFHTDDREQWFIMKTRSRHENLVEKSLREKNIPCYLPKRKSPNSGKSRKKDVFFPMFPGYIFVCPEREFTPALRYIVGSCGLISFNNRPAVIMGEELKRYEFVSSKAERFDIHNQILPGDPVVIVSGPLEGLAGELVRFNNGMRVVVNAIYLNKAISVELDTFSIEKTTPRIFKGIQETR